MNEILDMLRQVCGPVIDGAASMFGGGPRGVFDWLLVGCSFGVVVLVGVYTIKFLVNPRERAPNHIKRRILRDDF